MGTKLGGNVNFKSLIKWMSKTPPRIRIKEYGDNTFSVEKLCFVSMGGALYEPVSDRFDTLSKAQSFARSIEVKKIHELVDDPQDKGAM